MPQKITSSMLSDAVRVTLIVDAHNRMRLETTNNFLVFKLRDIYI